MSRRRGLDHVDRFELDVRITEVIEHPRTTAKQYTN